MLTRRELLHGGMSAFALGLLARRGYAFAPGGCEPTGAATFAAARPFRSVPPQPQSVMVNGAPFAPSFTGDGFASDAIPFHFPDNLLPDGNPPPPTESVDIAIVGGGISGLATAYLLREHRPVLLELHGRLGGAAQGERWQGNHYSLGSAYFITPDEGSFLERL